MTANGQGWGYVQERWVKAVAAGSLRRGWMAGARWFLPLPCHFIPKSSSSDPLVSALFQRSGEVASLAPTSIHDEPHVWWRQDSLRPRGDQLALWAGSIPRPGFGIVSKDAIARRDPSDPCAIPVLLGCIAPGRAVDDQARMLLRRLVDLYRINMIPISQHQWQGSVDSDDELLTSAHGLDVTSTPLLVRALTSAGLLPHYRSSSGSTDLPANTVLRSGLKPLLDRHAIPLIAERHARLDRPLKRLCWGWTNPDGDPDVPGFRRVEPSDLAEALARPGDCEVGGGLAYTAP